jgi:hypothetical protein
MTRIIKKDRSGVFVWLKLNSTTDGGLSRNQKAKRFRECFENNPTNTTRRGLKQSVIQFVAVQEGGVSDIDMKAKATV